MLQSQGTYLLGISWMEDDIIPTLLLLKTKVFTTPLIPNLLSALPHIMRIN